MTYKYFPSCNFTKASPQTSKALQKYLAEAHGIKSIGCCRPGHKKLEEGDRALTICLSCSAIVTENTACQDTSIFQFLSEDKDFPWPDYHGEEIALQDCWRARGKHELHQAVRSILEKMNMRVAELEESRDASQYCGVFRFNPMREDNIRLAPRYFADGMKGKLTLYTEKQQQALMEENAKRYHTSRVAVYCNSCLRGLLQGGARGVHVMELMFPEAAALDQERREKH